MTRRAGPAIFIVCFALVPWALEACGMAANVLEGEGFPDEQVFDAGWGGMMAMGAGGAKTTGGFAGLPASAGGTFVADAGIGAGGGPATGGLPGDPNAALRRSLAEELCSIPTSFPCLTLSVSGTPRGTPEEQKTLCRQKTESAQYSRFRDRCFVQWAANARCALNRTDYCPCDPDAGPCTFTPEDHAYGPGCEATLTDLNQCALVDESTRTEEGPAGSYAWAEGKAGCNVQGLARNGVDVIEAKCEGPQYGVQACTCVVNGIALVDHVQTLIRGENTFYADDCRDVASQLAAGRCADILQCCFGSTKGGCDCGAHPELAGYSSCDELAAASSAVVFDDVCPAYRP